MKSGIPGMGVEIGEVILGELDQGGGQALPVPCHTAGKGIGFTFIIPGQQVKKRGQGEGDNAVEKPQDHEFCKERRRLIFRGRTKATP